MHIKALIFDLDGVIANTNDYHFKTWQRLSHSIGAELTLQQYNQLKGLSRSDSLEKILFWNSIGLSKEQKSTLASRKNDWYNKLIQKIGLEDTIPGAIPFIHNAKRSGFAIALGSSSRNADTILRSLQIEYLFDVVVDGHKTTKGKPDPQVFEICIQSLGLSSDEVIIFEDAVSGIEAAKSLGIATIGIGEEGELSEADMVIPSFERYDPLQLIDEVLTRIPGHPSHGK